MKKLILIVTAITLLPFSSSVFAQTYRVSCSEVCRVRCLNAGQYQRTGCAIQCPANCEARRAMCAGGANPPGWNCERLRERANMDAPAGLFR